MRLFTLQPKWILFLGGALSIVVLSAAYKSDPKPMPYHSQGEMVKMMMLNSTLPIGDNGIFLGSGRCAGCHGIDPVAYANVTSEGDQVSPAENWRATMMANSAKDPLWRAKVAHEVSVNPANAQELVNKCTSCHAPIGRFTAQMNGQDNYSMEEMIADSLALDGVNCAACHQQEMENLGNHFSGTLSYTLDTIWGPYVSEELDFPIFASAMQSFVGYEPIGNHKVSQSEMCATCHSLLTNSADLEGNLTGGTFVEQATYHEWLNSSYNLDETVQKECQGCHMPRLDEPIVIASGYAFLPGREPFGQHWFAGGNSFMLELIKNRIDQLDVTANTNHFDVVIDRTLDLLQTQTANVELFEEEVDGDTARYRIKFTNLVGHKFPSGYPSRIAYVEFIATDDDGNVIFHSGAMNDQFQIIGQDPIMEPHYDLINSEDQVQIYEMVMGDVNGNITTVLERAATHLKDNRFVPLGFSTNHPTYADTTTIVGIGNDPNFNYVNGIEGSGTDEIRFHIPVTGYNGQIQITARLMYQSVPPKWTQELFAVDHPTINAFEQMYWEEGPDPVQIGAAEITSTVVGIRENAKQFLISPNPTSDGLIHVNAGADAIQEITVYSSSGQLVYHQKINTTRISIQLPDALGTYIVDIQTNRGRNIEKVVRR